MPTPFSHLAIAQRLLEEPALAKSHRALFSAELPAFLLGNIAPDARVGNGLPREHTHFYAYAEGMPDAPWRLMMAHNPSLWQPQTTTQQAFVAGYIAHLAIDEVWSRQMVGPHFVDREWGSREHRFVMLHVILIVMDERDLLTVGDWQAETLHRAQPRDWLPFIGDDDLTAWRDLIYDQIKPDGGSRTLEIFGKRAGKTPEVLRALLDDPDAMNSQLWDHIPLPVLDEVESAMYGYAVEQVTDYMERSVVVTAGDVSTPER